MTQTRATPLDRAFLAAEAAETDGSVRLRFYALLLETALFAPVTPVPEDAPIAPMVFDLESGPVALAFDDDARMAAFFDAPTEYVTLPGRDLIGALAQAGLGLGLNLGDAPSATLLDAATVQWIAAEMGGAVETADLSGAVTVGGPVGAPRALIAGLAERVAQMPGLVAEAWLVALTPESGTPGLAVLVLPGPMAARAMAGVVTALGRAAAVHGAEVGAVSVGVLAEAHPLLRPARTRGLALHPVARPEQPAPPPSPPPKAPPRLR